MKKTTLILCLMLACAGVTNAAYNYLCGVTAVTVTDNSTKGYGTDSIYEYLVQITQTCKNTNEYNKTNLYNSTADIVLYPATHQLEGTYSSADYSISHLGTAVYYSGRTRSLDGDETSTFTITKIDDTHYSIGEGVINVKSGSTKYIYNYCYNAEEIGTQGIDQTPFVFEYDPSDKTVEITPSSVKVQTLITGYSVVVNGTDEKGIAYTADIQLDNDTLVGEFSVSANTLSSWTSVFRSDAITSISYIKAEGTSATITQKADDTYTISANLICENGFTYIINDFDFTYTNPYTSVQTTDANNTPCRKFISNGQLFIQKGNTIVNILGVQQ